MLLSEEMRELSSKTKPSGGQYESEIEYSAVVRKIKSAATAGDYDLILEEEVSPEVLRRLETEGFAVFKSTTYPSGKNYFKKN